jgi:hypothetical protein
MRSNYLDKVIGQMCCTADAPESESESVPESDQILSGIQQMSDEETYRLAMKKFAWAWRSK